MNANKISDQRLGYLRLDSIDMARWKHGYMHGYAFLWGFLYLISNHFYSLLLVSFFFAELGMLAFCFPYIGIGDQMYPLLMRFEYSIPSGYIRYMFVIALGILLILKGCANIVWNGIMAQKNITLGEVMLNRYARRMISLKSYTKWRLFRYLISQLSFQEYLISWTIWCNDEWKRFIMFKSIVFVTALLQVYETLRLDYVPESETIRSVILAYWCIKIVLFLLEFTAKATALFVYLVFLRDIPEITNGCSLTDYYQNRIIDRASPFITLKNPFLEPLPETAKSSNFEGNQVAVGGYGLGTNRSGSPTWVTSPDNNVNNLTPHTAEYSNHFYESYDGRLNNVITKQEPPLTPPVRDSEITEINIHPSHVSPEDDYSKSAYFNSEYQPNKWSRGESMFQTDYEGDEADREDEGDLSPVVNDYDDHFNRYA